MAKDTFPRRYYGSVMAGELQPGMVTADGQEILDIDIAAGGAVIYHVFTPSGDEQEHEARKAAPEARSAGFRDLVELAPSQIDLDGFVWVVINSVDQDGERVDLNLRLSPDQAVRLRLEIDSQMARLAGHTAAA